MHNVLWHSCWPFFWRSFRHSIWHGFWHSFWRLRSGSATAIELAEEKEEEKRRRALIKSNNPPAGRRKYANVQQDMGRTWWSSRMSMRISRSEMPTPTLVGDGCWLNIILQLSKGVGMATDFALSKFRCPRWSRKYSNYRPEVMMLESWAPRF